MWKIKYVCLALCSLFLVMGCEEDAGGGGQNGGQTGNGGGGQQPAPFEAIAPDFNADSAYAYVERQLAFGPRIPNTGGHAACADWMAAKLKEFGAEVTVQQANVKAWDGSTFAIRNVIGSYKPAAENRIIVSAHWDTRPYADKDPNTPNAPVPGANDAGSGVGVILELARQLQSTPPSVGIDFMLWDAEDYGNYEIDDSWSLGSRYWTQNKHKAGYRAQYGINLDMVGAKDARFVKDGYSMQHAATFVNRYWSIAHQLGYGIYFPTGDFGMATIDDHKVLMDNAGIPMVEVIDRSLTTGEFFPHWHKTTDNMEQIDRASLKAVGQTTLEVILREK